MNEQNDRMTETILNLNAIRVEIFLLLNIYLNIDLSL